MQGGWSRWPLRGVCKSKGTTYRIVKRGQTVRIKEFEARVLSTRVASVGKGINDEPVKPDGEFVVVELEITNRTTSPKEFRESHMAYLLLKGDQYNVDDDTDQSAFRDPLQPKLPEKMTITFDVPRASASG